MVTIKTDEEIKVLRVGGKILASVLKRLAAEVRPGTNTANLEDLACQLIEKAGGRPSFKNYEVGNGRFFPAALCLSINNEIVHGLPIPGRIIKEGDIVSLDLGMEYPVTAEAAKKYKVKNSHSRLGGFFTDTAMTVPAGKISQEAKRLIEATRKSLQIAIREARPGKTLNDLGIAVENYVKSEGFSIVKDLVGHGVGYQVHEDPEVFNYEFASYGIPDTVLKPGMVIAIEPMVNLGKSETKSGPDGFSFVTADGSLSAHFEHTVAITEKGNIIITE
jgi:methionyl aminopeptidase